MKRLVLLAAVLAAGCASPPPPPDPLPAAARGLPTAVRHERTVIDTTTPIYGGLPAEKAAGTPAR